MAINLLATTSVSSLFADPRVAKNVIKSEGAWGRKTVNKGHVAVYGVSQSAGEEGG